MRKEEKIHIKELTPKSMSCVIGSCPGIYEFEKEKNSEYIKREVI